MASKMVRGRKAALVAVLVGGSAIAVGTMALSAETPASDPTPKTIGFVLTSWRYAFVETPDAQECGGALQPGEVAQLKATGGAVDRIKREGGWFEARGPNGETGNFSPLSVPDPLPWRELVTKTGHGLNIDGTPDGRATARTCKHEKFTNAEGEKVDNQVARVFGCVMGYRTGGQTGEFSSAEITNFPVSRHLLEITGVDDETNDPAVEVHFYKGFDRMVRTTDNAFLPFVSHRIDARYPKYNMKTKGRIVNGMLITDPIANAVFPFSSERHLGDRDMRDVALRIKLTPTGAEGLLGGYENVRHQWNLTSKRVTAELNKMSMPSIYKAFQRYADGYPDRSGQCQYISAGYKVTAVRAFIIHPTRGIRVAQN